MMKLIRWLAQYNKFLVALTMAVIYFMQDYFGVVLPVDETTVAAFWMFISAILTFAIPNIPVEEKEE
jgi:hypothetical protein